MKIQKLLSLSVLLLLAGVQARADVDAPDLAGQALLSFTHRGGFIAPPLRNHLCTIFSREAVVMRNGQVVARHPLRFSPQVPSLGRLYQLLQQARLGRLFSSRGTVPDVGTSEYRALFPANVILQRNAFPRGLRSTAPSAATLVAFTNSNCQ